MSSKGGEQVGSRVVLVTGVSRYLGVRLAAALAADPSVERVIGIDTVPPADADRALLGRTEFVLADIRNPLIGKVFDQAGVTTVVHAALMATSRTLAGRAAMQEMNVIGTMQLLAACQKSATVQRVVVKSTTAVYGGSAGDPAVFTESTQRRLDVRGGYARDAVDIEGYVRGFARRRPDISVAVLRLAPLLGPTVDTALGRYLLGPVVPVMLGQDPRLQVLHEDDAVEALRMAAATEVAGTVNVAADGVLTLSQAVRRARRLRVTVPRRLLTVVGAAVGNAGIADLLAEDPRLVDYGRVVDTSTLHGRFGVRPERTTSQTLDSFLAGHRSVPHLGRLGLAAGARMVGARPDDRQRPARATSAVAP